MQWQPPARFLDAGDSPPGGSGSYQRGRGRGMHGSNSNDQSCSAYFEDSPPNSNPTACPEPEHAADGRVRTSTPEHVVDRGKSGDSTQLQRLFEPKPFLAEKNYLVGCCESFEYCEKIQVRMR
jgi:hypothetical protein